MSERKKTVRSSERKSAPTKKVFKCLALKNRIANFNNTQYKFKKGERYELENEEHVRKLSDPLCGVLSVME